MQAPSVAKIAEFYFDLRNKGFTETDISRLVGKDRDFLYKIRNKWLISGTGKIEKFETVFS